MFRLAFLGGDFKEFLFILAEVEVNKLIIEQTTQRLFHNCPGTSNHATWSWECELLQFHDILSSLVKITWYDWKYHNETKMDFLVASGRKSNKTTMKNYF